ncbi:MULTISPECIES: hypothetical protein [unclassified Arcicella]|uniref:hypothetical protein n=1 Tax=unclassified Arcicella TaxID=2644986 RepID=UPI00285F867D|nr:MULTISPECIES: hypothetical protein [unclassified Arcicella]MDR6561808.1 tetratricopeptide (TPR) repeat protein [Arcicella sp. BE51]MDR6813954.1 tetratricopeptide (TPR) repeat protein [Arcicella sp. BE140]MDR6825339.1 tetratricopeptide (TPR) repeat protein [Arcicella sp. BE139]
MLKKLFIFTLLAYCTWNCSSGKKALEQGNYDEAVETAINRLQKSPTNTKAQQVLKQAFPAALNFHLTKIEDWKHSQENFRWERVVAEYQQIHHLADDLVACQACLKVAGTPKRFYDALQTAKILAADERFAEAQSALSQANNNRNAAKDAFNNFSVVQELVPTYPNIKAKLDESYELASIDVVVEQVSVNSPTYALSNEYFQGKINEFLRTNPKLNQFVRFHAPEEAEQNKLKPDQIIHLQFDDFIVGQTYVETNTNTVTSKDSVKVGETTVNGKKIAVYNKVTAKLTQSRKAITSKGILDFQVIDFKTKQKVYQDKIAGEFVWVNEWANFNGDERALTKQQLSLTRNKELLPPPPQQLFTEFTKPIYDQITRKIKKYYENY